MTDFMTKVRHQQTDYIIRSLMDVDFYKLTMGQFIHKFYRGTDVTFKLINRDPSIPLAKIIPEETLRDQLDHVKTLMFRRTDLYYLRGMDVYGKNMFSEEYLEFLGQLQLGDYHLRRDGDQYDMTFKGPWEVKTFWETISLAIISELYYRELMKKMSNTELSIMYGRATDKLYGKLKHINTVAALIADFGQRRRHSFLWQQFAIEMAQEVLRDKFTGTSNTWLAFNQDLVPVGTNAHEQPMVVTALAKTDEEKRMAQYKVLDQWGQVYGPGLKIVLPDTYGSAQFFKNMPEDVAEDVVHNWRGIRQDSGDPKWEADGYMNWLMDHDLDREAVRQKVCIFSDGLDDGPIVDLYSQYENALITPFGWGTKLTNDFTGCVPNEDPLFRPFSMVCKIVEADGNAAVKLSNNIGKATGPKEEIERYLRIFGGEGRGTQEVEV